MALTSKPKRAPLRRDWSRGFTYAGSIEVKPDDGGLPLVLDVAGFGRLDNARRTRKHAVRYVLAELSTAYNQLRADED